MDYKSCTVQVLTYCHIIIIITLHMSYVYVLCYSFTRANLTASLLFQFFLFFEAQVCQLAQSPRDPDLPKPTGKAKT